MSGGATKFIMGVHQFKVMDTMPKHQQKLVRKKLVQVSKLNFFN
jgi:hypothetical protein